MSDGTRDGAPEPVVRAAGVGRWYGEVVGLSDLTVDVGPGITGLVGPNGAGKSTFMKCIVGELRPHKGRLEVLGLAPFANRELYRVLGFCPQQDALYEHQTGREFVRELLRLAGFPAREANDRAVHALDRVGLTDAMDRVVRGYSKGMRQRARLAQAIAHDPRLVVADEPLTGLDPLARRAMLALFRELAAGGCHVIVSSHVLHEVESLTDTIVLVHRGRLLAAGPVREVRRLISRHPSRVDVRAREPRRLAGALLELEHVTSVRLHGDDGVAVETRDVAAFHESFPALAADARCGVRALESSDASLEAVFDYLVG